MGETEWDAGTLLNELVGGICIKGSTDAQVGRGWMAGPVPSSPSQLPGTAAPGVRDCGLVTWDLREEPVSRQLGV